MKQLLNRHWEIVSGRHVEELLELVVGGVLLLWGTWILNPFMSNFDDSPLYTSLVLVAALLRWPFSAETLWGAIVAGAGVYQLWALYTINLYHCAVACLVSMGVLLFLTCNFYFSFPHSPTAIFLLAFIWCARYAYSQIGNRQKESARRHDKRVQGSL